MGAAAAGAVQLRVWILDEIEGMVGWEPAVQAGIAVVGETEGILRES